MHDNGIDNNPSNDALSKSEKAREIKHQYQKKRNKKRYAAKFREVYKKKHGKLPQGIKEKLLYRLKENMFVKKYVLIGGGVTAIMAIMIMTALSSCGAIFTDSMSTVAAGSYQSKPAEIDAADVQMTEKEMRLQDEIDSIEDKYPGYDEYEYDIDPIGHDPFTLVSYLSAKHIDFTASDVTGDIESLYDRMYNLSTEEREETRTRTVTKTGTREVTDPVTGLTDEEEYEYEEEEPELGLFGEKPKKKEDDGPHLEYKEY